MNRVSEVGLSEPERMFIATSNALLSSCRCIRGRKSSIFNAVADVAQNVPDMILADMILML